MIRSMTGYGRADFSLNGETYTVEVRSLNNRFLDIHVRMPEKFSPLEHLVRAEIKRSFLRGSFSVYVKAASSGAEELRLNLDVARRYAQAADELKSALGIKGELDVSSMLALRDVFAKGAEEVDEEAAETALGAGLKGALEQVLTWREKEGLSIKEDLVQRLDSLSRFVAAIEDRAPQVIEEFRERITGEIKELLEDKVDEWRILHEAAIFAQRCAITEEVVRLKSHIEQFRGYLEHDEPVGKRCDFLCQEILREANTIGSKANDLIIIQTVVEIKGELEKIREQVQNIE